MTKTKRKNKTFFNILEIIVDIIVYPVILISFMSSFFMLVSKSKNVITPIFGHTLVRVLTNSMSKYCPEAERNFVKGDVVVLKVQNTMYQVGDVIAFYNYSDQADNIAKVNLTQVTKGKEPVFNEDGEPVLDSSGNQTYKDNSYIPVKDENNEVIFDQTLYQNVKDTKVGETIPGTNLSKVSAPEDRHDLDYVRDMSNIKVYFHQIVQIKIDTSGTIFYITKGTTNASTETVREDLVAGKYVPTGKWLTSLVSFCASTEGMIVLVVAPITFIVLIELLSILEQVNNILLEKKVIAREMPYDGKDCKKAKIGIEMRNADKIFYYDVMPPDYKDEVFDFLWGDFEESSKKKEQKIYEIAKGAVKVYNMKDPTKYYQYWKDNTSSKKEKEQIDLSFERSKNEKYIDVGCFEYSNKRPIPKKPRIKRKKVTEINKALDTIKEIENNIPTKDNKDKTKTKKS